MDFVDKFIDPSLWEGIFLPTPKRPKIATVQVKGVVHAAGTLADGLIKDMNRDNLQLVCSAKVIALQFFWGNVKGGNEDEEDLMRISL